VHHQEAIVAAVLLAISALEQLGVAVIKLLVFAFKVQKYHGPMRRLGGLAFIIGGTGDAMVLK
jgi:hypothetical protein